MIFIKYIYGIAIITALSCIFVSVTYAQSSDEEFIVTTSISEEVSSSGDGSSSSRPRDHDDMSDDANAPPNALHFDARVADPATGQVLLTWQNPVTADFDHIIIVRSETGFPATPEDGQVVYEGLNERTVDTVAAGTYYYYTLFVLDKHGNYSSGAVDFIVIKQTNGLPEAPSNPLQPVFPGDPVVDVVIDGGIVFNLWQTGDTVRALSAGDEIVFAHDEPINFSLEAAQLPENHLYTIIVSVSPKAYPEMVFSFLLTATADGEWFESTIGALQQSGVYAVEIAVYDFTDKKVYRQSGEVVIKGGESLMPPQSENEASLFPWRYLWFVPIMLLLLVITRIIKQAF